MHRWSYAAVKKRLEGLVTDLPHRHCSARVVSAGVRAAVRRAPAPPLRLWLWHVRRSCSARRRSIWSSSRAMIPSTKADRHAASERTRGETDALRTGAGDLRAVWMLISSFATAPRRRHCRRAALLEYFDAPINPKTPGLSTSRPQLDAIAIASTDARSAPRCVSRCCSAAWRCTRGKPASPALPRRCAGPPVSPRPASNPWWLRGAARRPSFSSRSTHG